MKGKPEWSPDADPDTVALQGSAHPQGQVGSGCACADRQSLLYQEQVV